jgi:hypothetical protein
LARRQYGNGRNIGWGGSGRGARRSGLTAFRYLTTLARIVAPCFEAQYVGLREKFQTEWLKMNIFNYIHFEDIAELGINTYLFLRGAAAAE